MENDKAKGDTVTTKFYSLLDAKLTRCNIINTPCAPIVESHIPIIYVGSDFPCMDARGAFESEAQSPEVAQPCEVEVCSTSHRVLPRSLACGSQRRAICVATPAPCSGLRYFS